MNTDKICLDGSRKIDPIKVGTKDTLGYKNKKEGLKRTAENLARVAAWQEKLYADGSKGLLVILQAMDAAGKDGTVKRLTTCLNAQGVQVTSFKQPSSEELSHDFLWRIHRAVPKRSMIGIFNRSHYEDVLVARVLDLPKSQNLPAASLKNIWENRYRQINNFEEYLTENGIAVLKFYLHISPEEQKARFLERLENPAKNWKFSKEDLNTREKWEEYMRAYRECLQATGTKNAPWYVVPSDKKWVTHLVVSEILADTLKRMNPSFPVVSAKQRAVLGEVAHLLKDNLQEPRGGQPVEEASQGQAGG